VAVTSVAAEEHVLSRQMRANPDSYCLLAGRQVWEAGYLAGCGEPLDLALEDADAPEFPIHPLPVGQDRYGGVGHGPYLTLSSRILASVIAGVNVET
jgi:hypothetical protein